MPQRAKTLIFVFMFAFFLNLIWENLHSLLYLNYQGGEVTGFILARAAVSDAVYISLAAILTLLLPNKKYVIWLAAFLLFLTSVFVEKWALGTSRWAYNSLMPIIPILNTGLTPTVQLAISGYISLAFAGLIPNEKGRHAFSEET